MKFAPCWQRSIQSSKSSPAAAHAMAGMQNPLDEYTLTRRIGRGSYGTVYRAEARADGSTVAVKLVPLEEDSEVQDLTSQVQHEVETLRRCDSPFVLRYIGSYVFERRLWLVTEFCEGGSVLEVLRWQGTPLTEPQIAAVLSDTVAALCHLHEFRMVHRDVKAANLLLTLGGRVKLADFGVSVQLQSTLSLRSTAVGTPLWMAPEVIREGSYSSLADVWSLGITAIEMAQMQPPHWELQPPMRALFRIPTAPPPRLMEAHKWSDAFGSLLEGCVSKEAEVRPTAAQLTAFDMITGAGAAEVRCQLLQPLASGRAKAAEEAEEAGEAGEAGEQGAALDEPGETARCGMAAWLDATEARGAGEEEAGEEGQGATLRTPRTAAEAGEEEEGLATIRLDSLGSLGSLGLGGIDAEGEGGTLRARMWRGEAARGGEAEEAEEVQSHGSGSCGYSSGAATCLPPDPPHPTASTTSSASAATTATAASSTAVSTAASSTAASAVSATTATATQSHQASAAPPPPPNRPPRPPRLPRPPRPPPASVRGSDGAAHTPRTTRALSTASSLFASLGAMEYVRIASHALDHTEALDAKGGHLGHLGHTPSEGGTLHKLRAPPSRPPTDLAYGETAEMAQARVWHGACLVHAWYMHGTCVVHAWYMLGT